MIKYITLSILIIGSINGMELAPYQIQASHRLGNVIVSLDDEGLMVNDSLVERYNMDKDLRSLNTDQLAKMLTAGAYISVNQSSDDEYSLELHNRLKGGGGIGATIGASVGFFGTLFVGASAIVVTSWAAGPLSPAVIYTGLTGAGPMLVAQAKINGIAGGIIGGTITGII